MNFEEFCTESEAKDNQHITIGNSFVITFSNKNGKAFSISPDVIVLFITYINNNFSSAQSAWESEPSRKNSFTIYEEKSYRAIYNLAGRNNKELAAISSLGGSQTAQLTRLITKFICFVTKIEYTDITSNTYFDVTSTRNFLDNLPEDLTILCSKPKGDSSSKEDVIRKSFYNWMIKNNLSAKTATEYSETVPKKFDKIKKELKLTGKNFYSIESTDKLINILNSIENTEEWIASNKKGQNMYSAGVNKYILYVSSINNIKRLSKPFILLAGISGTGKSRFVRQQAEQHCKNLSNYLLVPVRPDWHEPSDLLGYVSRISGERFVATPLLKFIVKSWLDAYASHDMEGTVELAANAVTFWVCLDEMNLAPVEQYFADYLSVIETREWKDGRYCCKPLVEPQKILSADVLKTLRTELGLSNEKDEKMVALWDYFVKFGISIPPNLVVAGTVNMDETTHGFSRKVIDRALTIDFGVFFPNDFDHYFESPVKPKTLAFSRLSSASKTDLETVIADPDGTKSISFIKGVNDLLRETPFELAYRALNELLVSVVCFSPANEEELHAVWDDFMMTKVLPRIEGDNSKLLLDEKNISLLGRLKTFLEEHFIAPQNSGSSKTRPDLFREKSAPGELAVDFRSTGKLEWMDKRLAANGFTSFWP